VEKVENYINKVFIIFFFIFLGLYKLK